MMQKSHPKAFVLLFVFIVVHSFVASLALSETDIWVLAGQSNMYPGLPLGGWETQAKLLGDPNPRISFWAKDGKWIEAVPNQVGPGFIFARHIVQNTDRTIGLIFAPWATLRSAIGVRRPKARTTKRSTAA